MFLKIFYCFIAVTVCGCSYSQKSDLNLLSPQKFYNKITQDSTAQLIDVRTQEEFSGGHIANAKNIDLKSSNFDEMIAGLDSCRSIFVYCLSGGRSHTAAEKLRKKGFKNVFELEGGLMRWRKENLPESGTSSIRSGSGMTFSGLNHLVRTEGYVLVDFYAKWCPPCKLLTPIVEKVAKESNGSVRLLRVNVDENQELAQYLRLTAIPVIFLYKEGKLIWQNVGLTDEATIKSHL